MVKRLTAEEIEAAKSSKGGWDRSTMESWGISWPPPKGWKQILMGLVDPSDEVPTSRHPSICHEANLLHRVVVAIINAGHGDMLHHVDGLDAYYGGKLPTVAEVIGSRPEHAVITGNISFDDLVYRFECARMVS